MDTLKTAIYTKFSATTGGSHNTFYNAVNGKLYYERAPQDATLPYAVYSIINDDPDWTFTTFFEKITITFNLFSEDESSSEIEDMYTYLEDLFDWCSFTMADHVLVYMRREQGRLSRDPEDDTWQYGVDYLIMTESVVSTSPSASPSMSPSASASPSASPSLSPSASPSLSPSASPSTSPSASPSLSPSASASPSASPSISPSASLSPSASESPSASPSTEPWSWSDYFEYSDGLLNNPDKWATETAPTIASQQVMPTATSGEYGASNRGILGDIFSVVAKINMVSAGDFGVAGFFIDPYPYGSSGQIQFKYLGELNRVSVYRESPYWSVYSDELSGSDLYIKVVRNGTSFSFQYSYTLDGIYIELTSGTLWSDSTTVSIMISGYSGGGASAIRLDDFVFLSGEPSEEPKATAAFTYWGQAT